MRDCASRSESSSRARARSFLRADCEPPHSPSTAVHRRQRARSLLPPPPPLLLERRLVTRACNNKQRLHVSKRARAQTRIASQKRETARVQTAKKIDGAVRAKVSLRRYLRVERERAIVRRTFLQLLYAKEPLDHRTT